MSKERIEHKFDLPGDVGQKLCSKINYLGRLAPGYPNSRGRKWTQLKFLGNLLKAMGKLLAIFGTYVLIPIFVALE